MAQRALLADEALEWMACRCAGGLGGGALALEFGVWLWILDLASAALTSRRDHGHAHGSRRSELSDHLGRKPWWEPWNSTGKPLLLVDPDWFSIDQLPSSAQRPLGCCVSTHGWPFSEARALTGHSMGGAGGPVQHNAMQHNTTSMVPTATIAGELICNPGCCDHLRRLT